MLDRLATQLPKPLRRRLAARFTTPMLREGEAAPEWTLEGSDGAVHQHGGRWTLLVFYPADGTSGCTKQLRDVQKHAAELEALGCQPYGVNPADRASHETFARDLGLTFPLLVDPDGAVARQYGCWLAPPLLAPRVIRTVYLVNPQRRVRLANRGAPSIAAILRSIQALQQVTRAKM